jgi:hypothetical protein
MVRGGLDLRGLVDTIDRTGLAVHEGMIMRPMRTSRSVVGGLLVAALVATVPAHSVEVTGDRWQACGVWTQVPTPLVGTRTVMEDVVVVSPSDAWAVGFADREHRRVPVTLHWDGWRWSVKDTPAVRGSAEFSGVAASGPDDVWAVGTRWRKDRSFALIRHWDGRRWLTVQSPVVHGKAALHAVTTTPGTRRAWAVGSVSSREHPQGRGLVFRWNGSDWRTVRVPATAAGLRDVTVHAGSVWVVGALVMRRSDGRWKVLRSPTGDEILFTVASEPRGALWVANYGSIYRRGAGRWYLAWSSERRSVVDLTFTAATDAWAVGGRPTGGEWEAPSALRRHGSRWSPAPFPYPEGASTLVAVDGTPHDVWVVGFPVAYHGAAFAYHYC